MHCLIFLVRVGFGMFGTGRIHIVITRECTVIIVIHLNSIAASNTANQWVRGEKKRGRMGGNVMRRGLLLLQLRVFIFEIVSFVNVYHLE